MQTENIHATLRFIRKLATAGEAGRLTDAQLLERYVTYHDEAAFEVLLHRHGAMVWRVCRQVLHGCHAAEDAFQATFLILVRKAEAIRNAELLGNWLYGVAYRVAQRARKTLAQQTARERQGVDMIGTAAVTTGERDMQALLQEELEGLPTKYRCPMVLCYLEGRTSEEAARQLHWPVGTLKVRLMRGREMLRTRLVRRGLALSAGAIASALSEGAAPAALVDTTIRAAFSFAAGQPAESGIVSAQALALTQGVLRAMLIAKLKIVAAVLLTAGVVATAAGMFSYGTMAAEQARATSLPTPMDKEKVPAGNQKSGAFSERLDKKTVKERGGTREAEDAVARGLRWLAARQAADGSWPGDCENAVAGAAFGVLPFLGAGHTHKASQQNTYDKVVGRGLKFLLARQDEKSGDCGGGMYAHGLSTLALCEAYGLSRDPMLRQPAQKAVDYIVMAQHAAGGWRYAPGQAGDTSVTGWQLQALHAAALAGLNVPAATTKKAMDFLDTMANADEGYGYTGGPSTSTMTASALLGRQTIQKWGSDNNRLAKGVESQLLTLTPGQVRNAYYFYYANQVLFRLGGKTWQNWNPKMRDHLVRTQIQDKGDHFGSWSEAGEPFAQQGGRLMVTSLSLLTLQVYYRYPPR